MKINIPIGFTLTTVFMILKLTGYINWSWVWVLAPMWVPFSLFVVCSLVMMIIARKIDIINRRRWR